MRPLRALLLCSLVLPLVVAAQPRAPDDADLSSGLTLPPTTAALSDEANAALALNPAGLTQVGALQLFYNHERSVGRNEVGDGLYLGNAFGPVALGFGVEWVRSTSLAALRPDRRKTTWGLGLGGRSFSIGGALGFFSSEESRFLDRAVSVDLGLLTRPADWLSFGAAVRNLNGPQQRLDEVDPAAPRQELSRRYELAVGLRPLGDRFTASVGYRFAERDVGGGRLSWVAQAEVYRGLVLGAGASHGLSGGQPFALQLSLTFNLPNLGLTYAGGGGEDGLDHVIQARLSSGDYPALRLGTGDTAILDLAQELTRGEGGPVALLGGSRTDAYLRLARLLAQAEQDPDLSALVVKIEALPEVGLGKAEELRQSMLRLRKAGKKVLAVIFNAGDSEYLIASAADRVYLVPQAMLMVNGLASSVTFLGGAMDKLGVSWDVARVGRFKNAPDTFTRSGMSKEQRETIEAYLDANIYLLESALAEARGLSVEAVRAAMAEAIVSPQRAVELKLADGVIDPALLDEELKKLAPGATFSGDYRLHSREDRSWGTRRKIAIVPVVGSIAAGKSREDPLGFSEVAGAQTVVRALKAAEEDPEVAAIVLRVDSGGGDGLASDLMYRAVLEAKKRKPVIASMGDVAASGGYYAAMGANRVFAAPTTLTGSIGVFAMKPALSGLGQKLGIAQETLRRGELSTVMSTWSAWTDQERAAVQKWVDGFYDDFITEVSRSRSLGKERVDEVARGRVWAGTAAKELGLVDELGTLHQAIDHARREAGIGDLEPYELEITGAPSGPFGGLGAGLALTPEAELPEEAKALFRALGVPPSVVFQPGVKAMLPFRVVVQ